MLDADVHGLAVTFAFESGDGPAPYDVVVRITGRRDGVVGLRSRRDAFVKEEHVRGVVPNSGPVTVTTQVGDINEGTWTVAAELAAAPAHGAPAPKTGRRAAAQRSPRQRLEQAGWSWRRWSPVSRAATPVTTRWAPLAGLVAAPAVVPGSYMGLIAAGIVVGLMTQARLVADADVDAGRVLLSSLLAVAAGIVGAKLWYLADRGGRQRGSASAGWCIQGFLAGAAVVLAITVWAFALPIGTVLDATTPGLFFGLAIGRWGCFFTGCCAGRPSAARRAVWSSDRRVGARRIPTQPLESIAAAAIGAASLLLYAIAPGIGRGALLVGAFGAYTLARQVLLRLRAKPRKSTVRGAITAVVAGAAVLAATALLFT